MRSNATGARVKALKSYQGRLQRKFGEVTLSGSFLGVKVPTEHKCLECGAIFRVSPRSMLKSDGLCWKCIYKDDSATVAWKENTRAKFDNVQPVRMESKGRRYLCKCCSKQFVAAHNWGAATKIDSCPKCHIKDQVETGRVKGVKASKFKGAGVAYTYDKITRVYKPGGVIGTDWVETIPLDRLQARWYREVAKAKAVHGKKQRLRILVNKGDSLTELPDGWFRGTFDGVLNCIRAQSMPDMRILSLDPGTSNCAWAVIDIVRGTRTVLGSGKVRSTVRSMVGHEFGDQILKFVNEIENIAEQFGTTAYAAERFMYRRGLNGTTMESVNAMIGAFAQWVSGRGPVVFFPASQWKNSFNSKFNLEQVYASTKQEPHVIDALLIGVYASTLFHGLPHYPINKTELNRLLKAIERRK